MSIRATHLAATAGAAFLLTMAVGAPAQAMLAPFDPAPASLLGTAGAPLTPHCHMGHDSWPSGIAPQAPCTA